MFLPTAVQRQEIDKLQRELFLKDRVRLRCNSIIFNYCIRSDFKGHLKISTGKKMIEDLFLAHCKRFQLMFSWADHLHCMKCRQNSFNPFKNNDYIWTSKAQFLSLDLDSFIFCFQALIVAEGEIQRQQQCFIGFLTGLGRDFRLFI